jgi:phage-related protein
VPQTEVIFYQDDQGHAPVVEWLTELRRGEKRAYAKCVVRIRELAEGGYELRRPAADLLRDGIHELRAKAGRVHYRILYFFHGENVAVLAHGITKEGKVPDAEIERALTRRPRFEQDPERHSCYLDL